MTTVFFIKAQGLRQIFTLVVQSLQQQFLHTNLNLLSREDISALLSLVSLAEQILSWDFSLYHILSENLKENARYLLYVSVVGAKMVTLGLQEFDSQGGKPSLPHSSSW